MSVESIMKWQDKEITEPLTKLDKEFYWLACQLFKNLMGYMTDRKSSKEPIHHARKHLQLSLNEKAPVKDEAYVQVLKQIKDHKDKAKAMRGWNFFAILASCYAPSTKLFYSILNYLLIEIRNNPDKEIVQRANYIFVRIFRSFERERNFVPAEKEITHIEQLKPLTMPIEFFSGMNSEMEFESYTTVRELKTNLMKKMQFSTGRIPFYCLYEICTKSDRIEERYLDDNNIVGDVIALWNNEIQEGMKKREIFEFKIYLKILLHYDYSETDVDTISMLYYQSIYDVMNGKFNLKEQDIINLAANQLLAENKQNYDSAFKSIQSNIKSYIPHTYLNLNPAVYWEQQVMEMFSNFQNSNKSDGKIAYIDILKNNSLWQAHQFEAKVIYN